MDEKNKSQLLRDKDEYPNDAVLKKALQKSFAAYEAFTKEIAKPEYGLTPEWRYYNDGKAWLCKITRRSKTILWLSVWEGMFKTGFYFTEATGSGIKDLDIDNSLKKAYQKNKSIGKLKPLTMDVAFNNQLADLLSIVKYKMERK